MVLFMMMVGLYASARGGFLSASSQARRLAAQYAAEAGLAETMESIRPGGFSIANGTLTGTLSFGATYTVEFKDAPPFEPYHSVNNLNNAFGAADSHRGPATVPPSSALIIVRANSGGVERTVEAEVSRGTGKLITGNAIQTSGTIQMSGDVNVDGIKGMSEQEEVPGNIHANADSGTTVEWDSSGSNARITGTVSSLGGSIDLSGYTPMGGPASIGSSAPFRRQNIQQKVGNGTGVDPGSLVVGSISLTGEQKRSGDMTVQGDLELDGATLYVEGNLLVNGSITGQGTIYVNGNTSFQGDSNVTAHSEHKVALLSHGDVTLSGFDGTSYLESIGDPGFQQDFQDLQTALSDLNSSLADPNLTPQYLSQQVKGIRRVISETHDQATNNSYAQANGMTHDTLGRMLSFLQTQPPDTSRDFLLDKLTSLHGFMNDIRENDTVTTLSQLERNRLVQEWSDNPHQRNYDFEGLFDAMVQSGNPQLALQDVTGLMAQLDHNRLGNSFFQGLIYTEGSLHASNEVSIIGALYVNGDESLPSRTLNGVTLNPGDLVLDSGVSVTFVEEFFDGKESGIALSGNDGLGVETWLGR